MKAFLVESTICIERSTEKVWNKNSKQQVYLIFKNLFSLLFKQPLGFRLVIYCLKIVFRFLVIYLMNHSTTTLQEIEIWYLSRTFTCITNTITCCRAKSMVKHRPCTIRRCRALVSCPVKVIIWKLCPTAQRSFKSTPAFNIKKVFTWHAIVKQGTTHIIITSKYFAVSDWLLSPS